MSTNNHAAVMESRSPAPFYRSVGDESEVFRAAARRGSPVLLKGPTGCGKTRFVEAMAHELGRDLITIAGHEDMTSADLVGRFLLKGGETVWVDGPLTRAVRGGAICYIDEIVEARQDTTVVIHPWPTTAASCRSTAWAPRWRPRPVSNWSSRTTPATRAC